MPAGLLWGGNMCLACSCTMTTCFAGQTWQAPSGATLPKKKTSATPPPPLPRPHHEHGLPPRLDVGHARQHHLADAADDELPDLQRAAVPHHHHKRAQEVVLEQGQVREGRVNARCG